MMTAIQELTRNVHADQPQGKKALRVYPILGPTHDQPEYRLLEGETLSRVKVTEVDAGGHVPELKVDNLMETRVYLMDGQELVGAKQNRILNTDVLVPAKTTLSIPVSCVEAGRWTYRSSHFSPGKAASHRIRSNKQGRTHAALKANAEYNADQSAVWDEVHASMACSATSSPTAALHDAYEQRQKDLDDFRKDLRMPEGAVGLAVFHGKQFLGLDLFDRPATLQYYWQSLLDSYAIDWLMAEPASQDAQPEAAAVLETLQQVAAGNWEGFTPPGEGSDYRLTHDRFTGSALVWDDKVVLHLQIFPRNPQDQMNDPSTQQHRPRIHRPYGRSTSRRRPETP